MCKDLESMCVRAREYWDRGQLLECGRLIHEWLSPEARPASAASILRLVLDKSGTDRSTFNRTLHTADHPRQWANGHRCFDLLRDETLRLDGLRRSGRLPKDREVLADFVWLAEFVAKVTYNAADPPDPFDEDSGWQIAPAVRRLDDLWNDPDFTAAVWAALCAESVKR